MTVHPIFLSVVVLVRNQEPLLRGMLERAGSLLAPLVSDYEIVVVDNASEDHSVAILKALTAADGLANLQVFALIKEVDSDTAALAGLESALGDWVAVFDPSTDNLDFIPAMLGKAVAGADVVYAANAARRETGLAYRLGSGVFNQLYKRLHGIDLAREVPNFRLLSRRVVNFLLQHPQPAIMYRHLAATSGFARANLVYSATPPAVRRVRIGAAFERGMRLLLSTTRAPMRIVTSLSLFGAVANLVYSCYVIAIALFKADVAPGWVTLSLQQSGMFFLISLVLLVLGEYILNMASMSNEGPAYHVAQEFTSARMTRREKLNLEVVSEAPAAAGRRGDAVRDRGGAAAAIDASS